MLLVGLPLIVPPTLAIAALESRIDNIDTAPTVHLAQAIAPAADGTGTTVTNQGSRFDISGGQPSADGANLFHSFEQFNVNTGQTANFLSNPGIQNILGRVTGGDASFINGLIQVTGGTSNLFLMNPAGIVFGPNAYLNVPASFTATTATAIGFGVTEFNALSPNEYASLVGTPRGFSFSSPQPGAIINQGNLSLLPGNHLTLLGGTILNTGTLSSPGGNITVAAVPGERRIRISQSGHLLSLEVTAAGSEASARGSEAIAPLSLPELLTGGSGSHATGVSVNPDGTIALTGSQIPLPTQTGTAIASGTLDISNPTDGSIPGHLVVLGERIALIDATLDASGRNGGGTVLVGGDFQGRGTVPNALRTLVNAGSTIHADALNQGSGGMVSIWADQVTGFAGTITARGGANRLINPGENTLSHNGGVVEVSGKQTLLFSGFVDTAAPHGTVGTLLIDPKNIMITADDLSETDLDIFNLPETSDSIISGSTLSNAIENTTLTLEAHNDIVIDDQVQVSAEGNGLTLNAGRSILLTEQGRVSLNGGDFTAQINDQNAIAEHRDLGYPVFEMQPGSAITTQGGDVTISMGTFNQISQGLVKLDGAIIDSGSGNIAIAGLGDLSLGMNSPGIQLSNDTVVRSTSGTISMTGTGGNGMNGNSGLSIQGTGTKITSQDGNITLTGEGAGDGRNNHGIYIFNGAAIESTGTGSITLTGRGSVGNHENQGIRIEGNSAIVALGGGDITLVGESQGRGNDNVGIALIEGSQITSTDNATIALEGIGSATGEGIRIEESAIAASNQPTSTLTLRADEITLGNGASLSGGGLLQVEPLTESLGITLGSAIADERLNLDTVELETLQPGFAQIQIGSDRYSGEIFLAGEMTFQDPVLIQAPTDNGRISGTGAIVGGNDATITLEANQEITTGDITTSGQAIVITSYSSTIDTQAGTLDTRSAESSGSITLTAPTGIITGNLLANGEVDPGNVRLTSDAIALEGTSVEGQGVLTLEPFSASRDIAIAANREDPLSLNLTQADLQTIQPGWTVIEIGRSDGTGTLSLHPFDFQSPVSILGGSTLIGANQSTDWTITGPDSGTISGFNSPVTFAGIENIRGGNDSDRFIFTPDGFISGNLDGVDQTDTLDYSDYNTDITINLVENTVTAVGGSILNIENFIGSGSDNNQLIGPNTDNTWKITSINAGILNEGISFSAIQNLRGGNAADTFKFLSAGSLDGNLNGAEQTNTLDYSEYNADITINLAENTATAVGGSIFSIENFIGSGSDNNQLIGPNTDNTWNITGINAGTLNGEISFSAIPNLRGGNAANTFKFHNAGSIDGNLDGSEQTNTLDYSEYNADITINLAENTATAVGGSIVSIKNFIGSGSDHNQLIGPNTENTWNITGINAGSLNGEISFSAIQNLRGGNAADTFKFLSAGSLDGNLEGTDQTDTLDYSEYNADITINLAENTASAVGGSIFGIENFIGSGSANNQLIGPHTENTWNITGTNAGSLNGEITFSSIQNLRGGNANEIFQFSPGSRIDGIVDGGSGGINRLDYQGYTTGIKVDIRAGTATGTGGIINIIGLMDLSILYPTNTVIPAESEPLEEPRPIEIEEMKPQNGEPEPAAVEPAMEVKLPPVEVSNPVEEIPTQGIPTQEIPTQEIPTQEMPTQEMLTPTENPTNPESSAPIATPETEPNLSEEEPVQSNLAPRIEPVETSQPFIISENDNPPSDRRVEGSSVPESSGEETSPSVSELVNPERPIAENVTDSDPIRADPETRGEITQPGDPNGSDIPTSNPEAATALPPGESSEPQGGQIQGDRSMGGSASNPSQSSPVNDTFPRTEGMNLAGDQSWGNGQETAEIRPQIGELINRGQFDEAALGLDYLFSIEQERSIQHQFGREFQTFSAIQERLQQIEHSTQIKPALIYTFISPDRLDLLVVPPEGQPLYRSISSLNRPTLLSVVRSLRAELTHPGKRNTHTYLKPAQQLYQWLIAPLEEELQALGIETLMFSMDEGLRSLPVAALHDGDRFLIEKYNTVLIPSINLTNTNYRSLKGSQVLAMGASEFSNYHPLPAVPVELAAITASWKGQMFLNEAFTLDTLQTQLTKEKFEIIHFATHSEFNRENPTQSYIQFWDEKLGLDKLQKLNWNAPTIELLVLSACRTALSAHQAELGFAGLALQSGVKSALASIWSVSDEGTLGLMSGFYQELHTAPIKAEALRQAQIAMLQGQVRLESGQLVTPHGILDLPPEMALLGNFELSHPNYWAGFTMIGSPW